MRIAVEALINAPPDVVYTVASDIPNWARFISAIEHIEMLTSGPVTLGTRFRETRKMFGRSATEEMQVAELTPPTRFALSAIAHGTVYWSEHTITPSGGGTRLALAFEGRPHTRIARLLGFMGYLFKRSLVRTLQGDLQDLKREAERRHREGEV